MNISRVLPWLAVAFLAHSASAQGNLNPPGAPAPTMKSLDQIEARIPISAATTPGDGSDAFIITNSGSYYLTTNFVASSARHGIRIAADAVTIDLNGFELNGAGVGGIGIRIFTTVHWRNLTIRNGSLRNWNASGIDMSFSRNVLLQNLIATGNGANGLVVGENSVVRDCIAYTNASAGTFFAGIVVSQGSVVDHCAADFNGNNNANCAGFFIGAGGTITHCTASQNNGPVAAGISTGADCTVADCAVTFQTGTNGIGISVGNGSSVLRCTASANSGSGTAGIYAAQRALIESCVAADNGGDGIRASNECYVASNTCDNNAGAAIHIVGQRNRVDNNHAGINAGGGIKVDATSNFIVRNSVTGNSINNYVIVPSNQDAQRLGGSSAFTSTDPWANFSF